MDYYTDQTIACCDCGQDFLHPARDQAFYDSRGFSAPRRCKPCRAVRKAERAAEVARA